MKPETSEEIAMKTELSELSAELKETNMVNEFATYARTERKINKLKGALDIKGQT